jgi:AcrR family transcriptional regulator
MSPRADVSEERKNQIIDAAIKVFNKLGFNKARMDDIVEESGLSKGTLYWYFKSKDEIIINVLEKVLLRELDELNKLNELDLPVPELLFRYIDITVDDFKNLEPLIPLLFEFIPFANRSKVTKKLLEKYYSIFMGTLTPIMERGIKEGAIIETDPQDISIALGAMIEGTIILKFYSPKSIDLVQQMRKNARLLIEGILINQ